MSSIGTHDYQAARQISLTTTGDIDNLDPLGSGLIIMNNATLATIRGIKAGYNGKSITIISNGAGQVNLAHNNINSLPNNRLFNFVLSSNTPLAAGFGVATYQYIGDKWKLINHNQGAWINIPHNAANFTASAAMIWTVELADQLTYAYMLVGKTLIVSFSIDDSSVSGTLSLVLRIALPGNFISARTILIPFYLSDAGVTSEFGLMVTSIGGLTIDLYKINFSNWLAAVNSTVVLGQLVIEVQ